MAVRRSGRVSPAGSVPALVPGPPLWRGTRVPGYPIRWYPLVPAGRVPGFCAQDWLFRGLRYPLVPGGVTGFACPLAFGRGYQLFAASRGFGVEVIARPDPVLLAEWAEFPPPHVGGEPGVVGQLGDVEDFGFARI